MTMAALPLPAKAILLDSPAVSMTGVLQALAEVGYQGGVHVELSRHGHAAPEAARRAYAFLNPIIERKRASHG